MSANKPGKPIKTNKAGGGNEWNLKVFCGSDGNPTCVLARPTIVHYRGCPLIHILFKPHSAHGFEHSCLENCAFLRHIFGTLGVALIWTCAEFEPCAVQKGGRV